MTIDFRRTSLADLAAGVRDGSRRARALVEHALERVDALDGSINAFVAVDPDAAARAADAIDAQVARGEDPGPLAGVPIGVKDLEDAAGFRTTKGSACLADVPPATADSVLVGRLRAAGAVVIGKTNTPELGWKGDTVNELFGATRNPWNPEFSPGGSSGGSAAAVAAGMVPLATASDGGGSIRIPAALCGLPGFKPSLGRVPSGGPSAPDWHHLSSKGPLATSVRDTVAALDVVVGPHPSDLRSLAAPSTPWGEALDHVALPAVAAWSPTLGYAAVDDEVAGLCRRAIDRLADLGVSIVEVDSVFDEDPVLAWVDLTSAYHARTLAPFRGTECWDRIDPGLRAMADRGAGMAAADLVRAEDRCHTLNLRLVDLFQRVDLLVTPTTAGPSPHSGQPGRINGAETANWVAFTYPFNLTRSPAGSMPAGRTEAGLPVGLQLVGPQHGDLVVLATMAAMESASPPSAVAPV